MRRNLLAIASVVSLLGAAGIAGAQSVGDQPQMNGANGAPAPGTYCPPGTAPAPAPTGEVTVPPGSTVTVPPGTTVEVQPAPMPYAAYPPPPARVKKKVHSPFQTSLSVGGGVADFVRERISDNTGLAGAWDARLTFGTRFPLAFEAGYLGTAQRATDPVSDRTLTTTQVFGDLRLNLTRRRIQPFITGGVGWANLHRWNGATTNGSQSPVASTNFSNDANSVVVPMGAGIAGYFATHGMIDLRGSYNLITDKSFTPTGARPDMWVTELRVGYAF